MLQPTRIRRAAVGAVAAATAATGVLAASPAPVDAAAKARVTVTIDSEGTDIFGQIRSKRRACKADRRVLLYLQRGARGGADDELFATDTSEVRNGVGVWETGNLGFEGRFYAKVRGNAQCKPDASPTIRVSR
ncbi:hypothetical protein [Nocardioides sp. TF02-7]|uniref:hypothetical protein n=1 Tax=Nocardioides sp. TF02-7 TaxID=2917724 RepID=UPI001F05BB1E|nr:hypothetical protein [Nocardioides sp. TF02-7]UMG91758.1 hypothetical protein MF408_17065 [Nocardioides sp. TF02-7]